MCSKLSIREVKRFYDEVFYKDIVIGSRKSWHFRMLAKNLGISRGQVLLDVGCGTGLWLQTVNEFGACAFGADISFKAISHSVSVFSKNIACVGMAEHLPYKDEAFDLITCLGSLEHFIDMKSALQEMLRVAKDGANFLFTVPNSGFLLSRLGLYRGTAQREIKEDIFTIQQWQRLFNEAGLQVLRMKKDLHVLSREWIALGKRLHMPWRLMIALALPFWPINWQYQVCFFCRKKY